MAKILLHLADQVSGLVVEPVHELRRAQLLTKRSQICMGGVEGFRRIGDPWRAQGEIVRGEAAFEREPERLYRRVVQRVYATSRHDGCGGGPIRRVR